MFLKQTGQMGPNIFVWAIGWDMIALFSFGVLEGFLWWGSHGLNADLDPVTVRNRLLLVWEQSCM